MSVRKPLIFTQHAIDAVDERKLHLEWIERTVWSPDWMAPDLHRAGVERRFRVIPEFGSRILRVACVETAEELRILTVFFDRKARAPR